MQTLKPLRVAFIVFSFIALTITPQAQTFTTLFSFSLSSEGVGPAAVLTQGTDGNLHGTTTAGGADNEGTIFEITPSGTLTSLYSFCSDGNCATGETPYATLVQASNGDFYGTTYQGGAHYYGTVFEISPAGELTTLYSFCSLTNCADGETPYAGLVQSTSGNFYGTTFEGGVSANCSKEYPGCGTIFEITPQGSLTTAYTFCSQANCADGAFPVAGLIQAANGSFYGATSQGGANGRGTIFELTSTGKFTSLYSFCSQTDCADGQGPQASLVQATNGNFYGTTAGGGANCISQGGCGTVFEITSAGKLTTLYSFCAQANCADGEDPVGLVQASNTKLYGTTYGADGGSPGTIFSITPAGKFELLYTFCSQFNCTDGEHPDAGLLVDTDGLLYGTTSMGDGFGTAFSLSAGIAPFIEARPASGKVGASVTILGTNLSGATAVTFHGTSAAFNVVSPSEISATVPTGATSGVVEVNLPSGTLKSNVIFRVKS